MAETSSKGSLEVLDKSDLKPLQLVGHAASILKINLTETTQLYLASPEQTTWINSYTFREQWVLKWLLRTFYSEQSQQAGPKNASPASTFLSQLGPWMLLLHLLHAIPRTICAEVLIERKFFQSLEPCIDIALQSCSPSWSDADRQTLNGGTAESKDGPPKKRRRLSPEQEDLRPDLSQVLFQVCARFAAVVGSESGKRPTHEHSGGLAWTSSAQENSNALAASLHVAMAYAKTSPGSAHQSTVLSQTCRLLALWECRPVATMEAAKSKEIVAFNSTCLGSCLEVLDFCKKPSAWSEQSKVCAQQLEKLIALHTILPARTAFNGRQSKQWKQARNCLSWQDVQPVYDCLNDILSPQKTSPNDNHPEDEKTWRHLSNHLYSIAVRLIPQSDGRRKQREQPWLDSLFAVLCYASCPALAKLEFTAPSTVTLLEAAEDPDAKRGEDAMCELLEVARLQQVDLSLQVLSYFAAAVLSMDHNPKQWTLLSKIVSLDVNVLVPGLGIPTTDYGIDKFRGAIHGLVLDQSHYTVLRDQILLPLVSGFARSRALKDFVEMWRTELQSAMALRPLENGEAHAIQVWEDGDVFARVTEMVRQYAAPSLPHEVLTRALEGLTASEGPTVTIPVLADVAICTAFLASGEVPVTSTHELQQLQNIATQAVAKASAHPDHHWRLWNLIYHVQEAQSVSPLETSILEIAGSDGRVLSLDSIESERDYTNLQYQLMERFQRFSIVVQQSAKPDTSFIEALRLEIETMEDLISTWPTGSPLWNGRLLDLASPDKLASSCLGVLISRPEILRLYPDLAPKLLAELVEDSIGIEGRDPVLELGASARDLFLVLIKGTQSYGSNRVAERINKAVLEIASDPKSASATHDLIGTSPLVSINKAQLRPIASAMFDSLPSLLNEGPFDQISAHLNLMDRLSSAQSVPFSQAGAWPAWIQLLTAAENMPDCPGMSSATVATRCIMSLLRRVVVSVLERAGKTQDDVLSSMLQWTKDMVKLSTPFRYGISRLLALLVSMDTLCTTSTKLPDAIQKDATKVGNKLMRRIGDDLAIVDINSLPTRTLSPTFFMLRALLDCPANLKVPDELRRRVRNLHDELALLEQTRQELFEKEDSELLPHVQALCRRILSVWKTKEDSRPKIAEASLQHLLESSDLKGSSMDHRHMAYIAERANSLVETLDSDGQADLLSLLQLDSWKNISGALAPCLISAVILRAGSAQLSNVPRLVQSLSAVAGLSEGAKLRDPTRLILSLENTKLTLDLLPKIINQATIDSLLASISLLLSSSSPSDLTLSSTTPDAIFDRITAILGSLLSRYRRRLSDRHHILLPILQQLLRCLFYPGTSAPHFRLPPAQGSNPVTFLKCLPHWLRTSLQPLPPTSAEKYTRIISSICNPSVSAAKSSSGRTRPGAELNDQTKRVKTLAGEHMQYLIMEYCRCALDGEIKSQSREKLLPGMYTVLESMSRELMRGMNAAMDPSARAIFKGLYDGWVRDGKWDRS